MGVHYDVTGGKNVAGVDNSSRLYTHDLDELRAVNILSNVTIYRQKMDQLGHGKLAHSTQAPVSTAQKIAGKQVEQRNGHTCCYGE